MRDRTSTLPLVAALLALGLLASCSTESPTAPNQGQLPPPGGSGASTAWNITVSASPSQLPRGAADPSTITIRVSRVDNGQAPPTGTTIIVSTSLGALGSSSGDSSTVASLVNGLATLLLFAGDLTGSAVIQAQLEASAGQATVTILDPEQLFITSLSPTSGSSNGGTRIRLSGTGFSEPLRLDVGGVLASIVRVSADGTFLSADTGRVPDLESFFSTEGCDTDGDGSLDGRRFVPKTVEVTVELQAGGAGGTESLPDAFSYNPADGSCKSTTPKPNRPRARFTFTKNGLTVLFLNQSTPAGLTYTWIFGDGSAESSDKDPVHTYAMGGTYAVTLRAVNSSGANTVTKTITVP